MTIDRPAGIADELQADLRAHVVPDRDIIEVAIRMLHDYQRRLDQPTPTPASIAPRPGPTMTPADVSALIGSRERARPAPVPMPLRGKSAREDHERSVENARRLDETVDRRAAATAAARILSGRPEAAGQFNEIYDQVLARLREGKADA